MLLVRAPSLDEWSEGAQDDLSDSPVACMSEVYAVV
jgi:hypothetical protein